MLQVKGASASVPTGKIIFEAIIVDCNCRQGFNHGLTQRCAAQICMDEDARGIDHRLNPGEVK
jgi:hypothetical protein